MHTIHFVAVELENIDLSNPDDWVNEVESHIDTMIAEHNIAPWSDWHQVGGGRWSNMYHTINAELNPQEWDDYIKQAKIYKANNIDELLTKAKPAEVLKLAKLYSNKLKGKKIQPWNALDNMAMNMDSYYFERLGKVMNDSYNADSGFFDASSWSSFFDAVESRAQQKPRQQFLIPVDFHF